MNKFILVLTQPKIVVVKRGRGSLDLSQTIIINYLRMLENLCCQNP